MTLRLPDIWPIAAPEAYKLRFARWNQQDEPLDVWARSAAEWQGWQAYRPARDDDNLVRPHGGLGGLTPAEAARIALAATR